MAYPTTEQMRVAVREFVEKVLMGQVITLDSKGRPSVRTLGIRLNDDFSVDIATNKAFKRLDQVRNNPNMMIIWVGEPPEGDARYPKTIAAKGTARVIEGEELRAWYVEREAQGKGIPGRTPDSVVENLGVIHFTPAEFRAEGFSAPGTPVERAELTSGFRFKL